ncbi:MAG: hypothetical protein IT341_10660 [Chloroflexi bacterium]|nr:hypothetical protein [Chloroflexota bacterium]
MDLTLSPDQLLLPTAFVTISGFVSGLVEVVKRLVPGLVTGREQQAAALLAVLFVGLGVVTSVSTTPPVDVTGWVAVVLAALAAWYGILRLAMGIHDDVVRAPNSLTGANAQG